ncbi:MATE family efflux transporter [Brachybacterium sp. GPGPB12]|uniref:MATE family efflux transporter n=1 Tax=Brachybacterium sp. GPGPB12 TaxID=3023517 RepID=UPI0031342ADA
MAEPLFVVADSAFIARVSTTSLAGLGLASTVLTTVVGLAVFLAYSTTAAVARSFGAGRRREAISRGIDACWLAALVGAAAALVLVVAGEPLLALFGPSPRCSSRRRSTCASAPSACPPCSLCRPRRVWCADCRMRRRRWRSPSAARS